MNMKKIMASVAASALAVSAMAGAAFADTTYTNWVNELEYFINPAAVDTDAIDATALAGEIAAASAATLFVKAEVAYTVDKGTDDEWSTSQGFGTTGNPEAAIVVKYKDANDKVQTQGTLKGELYVPDDYPEYTGFNFDLADLSTMLTEAAAAGTDVTVTLIANPGNVTIFGYNCYDNLTDVKVNVTYFKAKDASDSEVTVATLDTLCNALVNEAPKATAYAGYTIDNGFIPATTNGTNNEVSFEELESGLTLWTSDAIAYSKGAQIKLYFSKDAYVDGRIKGDTIYATTSNGNDYDISDETAGDPGYNGDSEVGNKWLGVDAETVLKNSQLALGINGRFSTMIQDVANIEDNTVTFDVDALLEGSSISAVGDIFSISVRANTDLNVEKIEVIIPDQASVTEPDETDATEDTDASLEGDETTAADGDADVDGDTDGNANADTDADADGKGENPGTGVALAIVPAIVAGAAVVASRKRK